MFLYMSLRKDNLLYDLKSTALSYFNSMYYVIQSLEAREFKIYNNLFPVTSGHIPGHVYLDTTCLAAIFNIKYDGLISDNYHHIWSKIFHMKRKAFKSFKGKGNNPTASEQYRFAYIIKTDGVSVSLLHRRSDLYCAEVVEIDDDEDDVMSISSSVRFR